MAMYMSSNPYAGMFGGGSAPSNPLRPGQENPVQSAPPKATPTPPIRPGQENPQPSSPAATQPPNVLGPGAVRPSGPSQGFDPQYLQNLATAIGGQFSRPQGNLNFNPLGNLSDISGPSGLPSTWLQDALNGLGFAFQPPAPAAPNVGTRGNNDNGFGPRGPRQTQL